MESVRVKNLKTDSMKQLIILLTLILTSCTTSYQEKDIRVYYQDGSVEDLTISTKNGYPNQIGCKEATIYFNDGCLYTDYNESKYNAPYLLKYIGLNQGIIKTYNKLKNEY